MRENEKNIGFSLPLLIEYVTHWVTRLSFEKGAGDVSSGRGL